MNWGLSGCFSTSIRIKVLRREPVFRKTGSLVEKTRFCAIRKKKWDKELKNFYMKDGRQRFSFPVLVGYMVAMLLYFIFMQATNSFARLCISWAYQEMKKTLQFLSGNLFFGIRFRRGKTTFNQWTSGKLELKKMIISFSETFGDFCHFWAIAALTHRPESTIFFLWNILVQVGCFWLISMFWSWTCFFWKKVKCNKEI